MLAVCLSDFIADRRLIVFCSTFLPPFTYVQEKNLYLLPEDTKHRT
jgi:hypothetical protein